MSLEVQIINATNVPNAETFGKSDPYVFVEFQGQENKTEVQKSELNPTWNETFAFDLRGQQLGASDVLQIIIKDYERVGRNRVLAQYKYPMKDISKPGRNKQQLALKMKDGKERETECILNLVINYQPPPGAQGGAAGGAGAQQAAGGATVVGQVDDEEEEEEEEGEEEPQVPLPDGTMPPPRPKKKTKPKKRRGKLSTKPQDFQIRIKVVEARQIPGANISPIARVTCFNQTKQSRVQKSTNSPYFNEVFYFNFFQSPAELFDEVVTFGIYNSRKLRSDAFIGSFKCDIGMIYEEAGHSLLNKWLLLCDPSDSMAGAKGYLKICATVLAAGDEAPSFKSSEQNDDEDIEANLLRPAGVQLRPATFTLKVYQAEDLPRMDSDLMQGVKSFFGGKAKKELVDPYFVFSFAGKEVQSKTMYHNDHPDFNQELRLGLRFPSMCERIKLQMFDWDRMNDNDVIGSALVSTSQISASGNQAALDAIMETRKREAQKAARERAKQARKKKKSKKKSKDRDEVVEVTIEPVDGTRLEMEPSEDDDSDWDEEIDDPQDDETLDESDDPQVDEDGVKLEMLPEDEIPLLDREEPTGSDGNLRRISTDDKSLTGIEEGSRAEEVAREDEITAESAGTLEFFKKKDDPRSSTRMLNKNTPEDIESLGSGFLPTFGPCFVNFYGSPREFSALPDEYEALNLGKAEGVAYRGRALVELKTTLGELPEIPVEDIIQDDILRVQKFMRRRKYRLHAAFLNATMVSAVDAPVEFEVSIGNYGNKLDESVPPCSSTTQPTNAVFDGSFYYFLPWGENKPCCMVESHWEDISYRLEALNLLLHIGERLEENLKKVRVGMQANLSTPELAQLVIQLLNVLIADVSKPLPQAEPGRHIQNNLDKQMQFYRELELEYIRNEAMKLRESATDMTEALNEVENYLAQLKHLAVEPQCSMPDVVIWMITGSKRIAYYRCPAHLVLWSSNPDYRGSLCGKLSTITLKYPEKEEDSKAEIPAMLRMKLWLGLEKHETEWYSMQTEGELAVFAETYENQISIIGNWTNRGPALTRPKWSDMTGKLSLKKEAFEPPPGWRWDGDWYISPELSMLFDKDAGHTSFLEDVYECQSRYPGRPWGAASVPWADVKGDASPSKEEIELPEGWAWEDVWESDLNRAVDEDGFEYTVEATMGGYGPVCKNYHLCRRRRWVRARKLVKTKKVQVEEEKLLTEAAEGWEYAPLFSMKFHHKERKVDLVRRRRWHRRMVCDDPSAPCFFNIPGDDSSDEEDEEEKLLAMALTAPRMFLTCKKPEQYQLRAYVYQARDLLAADSSGLSDPFARIVFLNQSQRTEKVEKSVCPTWDQTLIYESVDINGNPEHVSADPPKIVIEFFDHDTFGSSEFLGRASAQPIVKLDPSDPRTAVLQWFTIYKGGEYAGELLAAFELFLANGKDLPFLPPKRGDLFTVPSGIRPVLQRTGIEIMCWGVRNMRKFQLASVTSPSIELEVNGKVVQSKVIKDTKRNPNFDDPVLFLDIMLPKEELYTPPMNVRVRDNRQFGRKPLVGIHTVKSLQEFRCDPLYDADKLNIELPNALGPSDGAQQATGDIVIDIPDEKAPISETERKKLDKKQKKLEKKKQQAAEAVDEDIDWWSKYYASVGELEKCKQYLEHGYDKLEVLGGELEKVCNFNDFTDFCNTFELQRGKADEEESSTVGEFKGTFKVYALPDDPNVALPERVMSNLPSSAPEECIIRVYVIRALDLQPNDSSGLADPYVQMKIGKKKMDTRDNYIPNSLNPVFGRCFETKATLPMDKDLTISVLDYDLIGSDDVIGETVIDLENRLLSKHSALVGLSKTYCVSGPNEWRDGRKPKEILEAFCTKHHIPSPVFTDNHSVKIASKIYRLSDFELQKPSHTHLGAADQRLALHILNSLPAAMNCPLVPEHIEARPLYNPLQPGIEQGKLQMWVDIFPKSLGEPGAPVDIKARVAKKYELRVVIWNTVDVKLDEESITGEQMSDIYVKGWVAGIDEKQETDVHYRSLDGEGNFNWRFVFPFDYVPAEEKVTIKKKEHFWNLDETETNVPPIFMVQVWDNDKFSGDDFLGTLELNMNKMPKPMKKPGKCTLEQLQEGAKNEFISLFEQRRVRGFWPVHGENEAGEKEITGKVEMEIELVNEGEARERPAAVARDDPNENPHLEPPQRPETSFLWFTSPWKTFKYIIWKNYKWYFLTFLILLLLVVFIALFIYAVPGYTVQKIFGV